MNDLEQYLARREPAAPINMYQNSFAHQGARLRSYTASYTATSSLANITLLCARTTSRSTDPRRGAQTTATETTQITGIGSPAYMSPEQVKEMVLTHQTDIFSPVAYKQTERRLLRSS